TTWAVMRPVDPARIGVEVQLAGVVEHISGCCRVGGQTVHVHRAVAVAEVDAGGIAMAGDEAPAPDIEPGLHAKQPASGTRFRERLVAVVDLLAKDPRPAGTAPALTEWIGILHRQCVADTLM